jgi:hypothetical protein
MFDIRTFLIYHNYEKFKGEKEKKYLLTSDRIKINISIIKKQLLNVCFI